MSSNIVITIPSVNVQEVKYVFNCLMSEFLGLEYDVVISKEASDFRIVCNSMQLEIANVFFRDDVVDNLYVESNIPVEVLSSKIELVGRNYPQIIIFGTPNYGKVENGIRWDNDIVAATFYMLTRWEELVVLKRDEHNRFMAKDSLAYKNNFLHRAIVNEYVEILYETLVSFGMNQKRRPRKFNIVPTHDIDRPYLWTSLVSKVKSLTASLLLRRNKEEIKHRTKSISSGVDPYDTFDRLMDMAESIDVKAYFFFMSGGNSEFDNYYQLDEDIIIRLIANIKNRNHFIGIHPSYNSCYNQELLTQEIETLTLAIESAVEYSRQHFLRFDISSTWNNLNKVNVVWDSTMCYADVAGFRSGVCYEYSVYDIKERRQLLLREKPLIVMDTTLQKYEKLEPAAAQDRVADLQKEVKRYEGDFVFLWHNSSFNSLEWLGYETVFKSMYQMNSSKREVWA